MYMCESKAKTMDGDEVQLERDQIASESPTMSDLSKGRERERERERE